MCLDLLVRELGMAENEVFMLPGPLDLRGLWAFVELKPRGSHRPRLPAEDQPQPRREQRRAQRPNVLEGDAPRDVLLHHPYDSFSTSVQRFLEQAAADPKVLAIKQTLYRTSGDSPIIDALIDAAEAGKQVLASWRSKARFDRARTSSGRTKLERCRRARGVRSLVGLKTHCKLSMVIARRWGPSASLPATSGPATTTRRPLGCTRTSAF